jgi:energy-coupling factor transporter ATP-binding protein EcfA2
MISELKIRNFKSLKEVDVKLGYFNLLIGANASGKSNFMDALRFLQGVGNRFALSEVLDGKPPSATSSKWDGIRGGSRFIAFKDRTGDEAKFVELVVKFSDQWDSIQEGLDFSYNLALRSNDGVFSAESEQLILGDSAGVGLNIRTSVQEFLKNGQPETLSAFENLSMLSLVAALASAAGLVGESNDEDKETVLASIKPLIEISSQILKSLADMQFLDFDPQVLKRYAPSGAQRMGENGEAFPAIVRSIEEHQDRLKALVEWLRELRPDEIENISTVRAPAGEYMLSVKEGSREFLAPSLSDGTLRFIALAAAFFQPSMPKILVIEEIEKGLHPSRLRLLLELMRSQSKRTGTQVFATTHSPTLLAWLNEEDRKTAFVCTRDAESGATKMHSLADVPRLEELIKKGQHIDQLFEEGWLESALYEL